MFLFSVICFAYEKSNQHEEYEFRSFMTKFMKNKDSIPSNALPELYKCANNENRYCAFLLGHHYYKNKEYLKAYPYLLKSEGSFKAVDGKDVDLSDVYLGNMFSDGLGVEKNTDKAFYYYSRCMTAGDDACAYNMSMLWDDPVKTYTYTLVALKLQRTSETYNEKSNPDISAEIKTMQKYLDAEQIRDGDKLANEICSKIPSCHST